MKTRKLITALLMPAMFVACNNDEFENLNLENNFASDLVEDVAIAVGVEHNATESRADFAGGTKGVFDRFYFAPKFVGGTLQTTSNSAIMGDQVGLALPSAAADGKVVTNVPFYIAGYQAKLADGTSETHTLAKNNAFYESSNAEAIKVAFETSGTTTTEAKFNAAVAALGADGYEGVAVGKTDIQRAVFKSVSGVMKGNYVLYYPYDDTFVEQGKIPALPLKSIQQQEYTTDTAVPTTDHVVAKDALFAYSKTPFAVAGGKSQAKDMAMTPAAYFFQFKVFTSASSYFGSPIKLITVSTADDAKAFGVKGYVTAGTTNTFAADEATAVDMIGVEVDIDPADYVLANEATYKTNAATAYLSTYAIPSQLASKNIVVRLYDTNGKVATIVKSAAGSAIVEGGTDYWKLDLSGVKFETAERLVYNEETLSEEIAAGAGTLVLKNNITVTDAALTIPSGFTINGQNYTLTMSQNLNLTGTSTLNTTVKIANGATLNVGDAATGIKTASTIATVKNEGSVIVNKNATLNATTINNGGRVNASAAVDSPATFTVNATNNSTLYTNGKLVATAFNNAASVAYNSTTVTVNSGSVTINGSVENTTFDNNGLIDWNTNMSSTVTMTNDGTLNLKGIGSTIAATITNNGELNVSALDASVAKTVKAVGATITNNGELNNYSNFMLSGATVFTNNKKVNDYEVFSGLSRLTNAANAEVVRTVHAYNNLDIALNEEKITGVEIASDITVGEKIEINTSKKFYLKADLVFNMAKNEQQVLGEVAFIGGTTPTLTGYLTTGAMTVNVDAFIGANSVVTVNGNINITQGKTLTGGIQSYTMCEDIIGRGTTSGPIYVK